MTILPNCPKKKPQQASGNNEIEASEANSNGGNHLANHNQHQLPNIGNIPSHIPVRQYERIFLQLFSL